jgi:hypothetical protein
VTRCVSKSRISPAKLPVGLLAPASFMSLMDLLLIRFWLQPNYMANLCTYSDRHAEALVHVCMATSRSERQETE